MPSKAALERALFDRQRAAIDALLGEPASELKRYEARYRRAARRPGATLSEAALQSRVRDADAVFVGDYFTYPAAQSAFVELVERSRDSRPTVIALSTVPASRQKLLDRWVASGGALSALRTRLGLSAKDDELRWRHLEPLLRLARRQRVELLALDGPCESLEDWDLRASSRLAKRALKSDRPRVFTLAGQFHVAPCHLPAQLRAFGELRTLSVYQSLDSLYFALPGKGAAVALGKDALCLRSGTPIESQQSLLELAELDPDDCVADVKVSFRDQAQEIARALGVKLNGSLEALTLCGPGEVVPLAEALERSPLRSSERAQVIAHAISRESGYFPGAQLAYLASRSQHHAAEEAAHFVRHAAAGRLDFPRGPGERFDAHVLEEALAFFAARRVDPTRSCRSLSSWRRELREDGPEAELAALVISLSRGADPVLSVLQVGTRERFHEVTHAVGYLLGDALDRRWRRSPRLRPRMRALFAAPPVDASARLSELRQLVRGP